MAVSYSSEDIYNPVSGRVSGAYMTSEDGSHKVAAMGWGNGDEREFTDKVRTQMQQYVWRDEDFLLTTYPKTGKVDIIWSSPQQDIFTSLESW